MQGLRVRAALLSILLAAGASVRAQVTPPEEPKTVFSQLFPNPTGTNGYEDLVMASDLARRSEMLNATQDMASTLAMKRAALNDLNIQQALRMVRNGLAKPTFSPRDPNKMDENTLFPDLAQFRMLARLLATEQYVRLSEGNIGAAIEAMTDTLRLGRVVQTDSLIGGLVGIAIDAIAINPMARHINQLSFRDCERVEQVCENWLNAPSPFVPIIEMEREFSMRYFKKHRVTPDETLATLESLKAANNPSSEPESREEKEFHDYLTLNPDGAGKLFDKTAEMLGDYYNAVIEQANKSAWERKSVSLPTGGGPASTLISLFAPTMGLVMSKYDQDCANLHLLGTQAALRRFCLVHDRLPDSLKELRAPKLTLDPFTGDPLRYKRTGDTYDLYSAGPPEYDDKQQPTKNRRPLYLPYRRN